MTFPATPLDVTVELYYSGGWQDITAYTYTRDQITITRGRSDMHQRISPSTCTITLNNRDGRFSPRNPVGALYGLIGRNTPLRVSVTHGAATYVRFVGEVSAWPVSWDVSGADVWVSIEASGITRRLSQGDSPLRSVMYRYLMSSATTAAYWPCEDGETATEVASALSDGTPMLVSGAPSMASYEGYAASDRIPVLGVSSLSGRVLPHTQGDYESVRFLASVPSGGDASTLVTVHCAGGVTTRWEIRVDASGYMKLYSFDADDNFDESSLLNDFSLNGKDVWICLALYDDAPDDTLWVLDAYDETGAGYMWSASMLGTSGVIHRVVIAPQKDAQTTAVGHVHVDTESDGLTRVEMSTLLDIIAAYAGETTAARYARLCTEQGVTVTVTGTTTQTMGPQTRQRFLDLLDEIEAVDGMAWEARDAAALRYRTTSSLYNQDPGVSLSYTDDAVAVSPPTDDDDQVRNDITITRTDGASTRAVLELGALSTAAPPSGVGTYDDAVTLAVATDAQTATHAWWRLHLGTWDEPRYEQISVDLSASPDLIATAAAVDIGDVVELDDLPTWLPPGPIRGLVYGTTEVLGQFDWSITWRTTPSGPWDVVELDDATFARLDSDTTTLAADVTTTGASMSLASTGAVWIDSTGYATEFPFDVLVGGEQVTVTAITGTTSPQTATVTRSVNGVVKAHSTGAPVHVARPVALGL